MEFTIGQHVSHPTYGPGKIIDIDEHTIGKETLQYYVINIFGQKLTTKIPVDGIDKVGLRSVISKKQTEKILSTLQEEPETLPKDFKKRQSQLKKKIFSGRPIQVAQAIRELTWRRFRKGQLNTLDKKLLDQGKDMLVAEVAIATDKDQVSALASINSALWSVLQEQQEPSAA